MKRAIVMLMEEILKKNNFDGLYNHEKECSCSTGDLLCCADHINGCVVARKTPCDCAEGCEYHLKPADIDQPTKH